MLLDVFQRNHIKEEKKMKMKKITALLLAGTMVFGMMGCKKSESEGGTTAKGEVYTINFNANEGNVEGMPNYQFIGADVSAILAYDSRLNVELTLELDGKGNYELKSDCYVIESEERQEVGSETGIGQTWTSDIKGTYTENEDGTITTSKGESMTLKVETDTYSSQIKDAIGFSINGSSDDGEWDSKDCPEILDFAPETVFTVKGDKIVSYEDPNAADKAEEKAEEENGASEGNEVLKVDSDDKGTAFKFFDNGTYAFRFESYDITDEGTFTYENGTLTLTDKNGKETTSTVEGDNVKFHYEYSDSDMLTGDYTIPTADLDAALN